MTSTTDDQQQRIDLRKLEYYRDENPLLKTLQMPTRQRRVQSILTTRPLMDAETGERLPATTATASYIRQIIEVDAEQYVKVFTAGIVKMYDLTKTAQRVFQLVLATYEATPITNRNGWVDSVYIPSYSNQAPLDMSEQTFNKGLKELLSKQFLAPRSPNLYWINPALFFKGNRFAFISEYRRTK